MAKKVETADETKGQTDLGGEVVEGDANPVDNMEAGHADGTNATAAAAEEETFAAYGVTRHVRIDGVFYVPGARVHLLPSAARDYGDILTRQAEYDDAG